MAYRISDNSEVPEKEARALFAKVAIEQLELLAQTYDAFITYGDLAELVQVTTNIRTRVEMRRWIGPMLGIVVDDSIGRSIPLLSSLCVTSEETVGDGYAEAVLAAYGVSPVDPDQHAAEERLKCYKHFGATLPSDGGQPQLTPKVHARRVQIARQIAKTPRYCPIHGLQLTSIGKCDMCDE